MKNAFRWMSFTAATVATALLGAFALLFMGRLYVALQGTAFIFGALVLYSGAVAIAAINFAVKLDEEAAQEDAGLPSRETHEPHADGSL